MKKNILILASCIVVLASCKKGGDGLSNTLMLGEVYRNGHLDAEYIYTTDKDLVRHNEYNAAGNQSVLYLYVLYEYTGGLISKRKTFASDTLNNFHTLTYDNANRLSRMDWHVFGPGSQEYRLYEYNAEGLVSKYTIKSTSSNKTKSYVEFTYDNEGRLTNQKNYSWQTDHFFLFSNVDFTPAGKNVYKHWQKFKTYPSDLWIAELSAEVRHVTNYNDAGTATSDWTETSTNRQYNSAGYLVKQTVTKTYVKPANPSEVRQMEYNYVD